MAPSKTPKRKQRSQTQNESVNFELKPDSKLQITIETGKLKSGKIPVKIQVNESAKKNSQKKVIKHPSKFEAFVNRLSQYDVAFWLFVVAIGIYLITRLIGLTHFPIYFFTDEAIQTQSIDDLISNGYRDLNEVFLPPYFQNGDYFNLSLSVYLQWIPMLLFGKSALVTRATSVLVTVIAAFSVGFILRDTLKSKYWWAGVLFLSITPAWFFHSRTAFETAEFVAFYAGTLCFYLLYRYKSPKYLYLMFLFAAFSFYSYSPAQLIVPLTALMLIISDWRYHWENRNTVLKGLVLLAVLVIPYLRYRMEYPSATYSHLYILDSYLVTDIPLIEKIKTYLSEYAYGLSASYWYISNDRDLPRHLMKDYGHIMIATLPFAVIGLSKVLTQLKESANRTILIALLVAPVSTALVQTSITRILVLVIPVAILTTIGLEQILLWLESPLKNNGILNKEIRVKKIILAFFLFTIGILTAIYIKEPIDRNASIALILLLILQTFNIFNWIKNRIESFLASRQRESWSINQTVLSLIVFIILAYTNIFVLYDSLKNGPLWYRDYGMGGLQYGAFQVFDAMKEYKQEHPETKIIFSPNWANGTNVIARFFFDDPLPFEIASVEGHITQKLQLDDNTLFVMTLEEYKTASSSEKFTDVRTEKIIPYPDDTPGFYFVRLQYSSKADEIFVAEKNFREALRESFVTIDGQEVKVKHSYLDAGDQEEAQKEAIKLLFDRDELSLAKTFEANPFIVELTFPSSRVINGFSIVIGSARAHITLKCYTNENAQPIIYTFEGQGSIKQPELSFDLPQPIEVKILTIEMFDPLSPPPTKIHIWEIFLR